MQQPMQNLGIQIIGNMNGLSVVSETVDQYGNVNVVTTLAEGNGNGINVNSIKCYNCRGEGHYASNCTVKPRKRDAAYLQQQLSISQEEEAGIQSTQEESNFMATAGACEEIERSNANCTVENNLQQASTSGTQTDKAPVYDSDGSAEIQLHDNCYNDEIFNMFTQEKQPNLFKTSNLLQNEANESLAKHKELELEIERLLRAVVSQDIMSIMQNTSVVDTSNLQTELEHTIYENASKSPVNSIRFLNKVHHSGRRNVRILSLQAIILGKPPSSSRPKLYDVTPLPKSTAISKVGETNALSNQVTSNSVPSSQELKVMENDNVIAPGMFRIDPRKTSRKNDVNSKTNGFSPKDVKSTTRTRRPQPRNNPKNDKHIKHWLAIRNAKSKVVCAMCKQCLITVNHDVCVLNYVNDMNSRALNKNSNVENVENQKKHRPKVWKPKKAGSKERLASPKLSTPRSFLRWSPTGRIFDLKGKIIATSESECQSDCFKGDNACTSKPSEPTSKRFPNSTFSMKGHQNWFDTLLTPLLSEYKPKDKENHGDNECDS
ncbi:retrovirus-related pol polyprotein from transposon TNT 1-94 [Tanacetum coccineum]|uniref:Retrovirus-related pol polyprotein from transposon TNT 1-94 n=1 Tax=Tanacetum coccineum TaxID=301880 RepID=A0ABQ4XPZ8_9ASTR